METPTTNNPAGFDHHGFVTFAAIATGTGTWSITYSFTTWHSAGFYDFSSIQTITITNTTTNGVGTYVVNTGVRNFVGWVSAVSGTVLTSGLYVEGA